MSPLENLVIGFGPLLLIAAGIGLHWWAGLLRRSSTGFSVQALLLRVAGGTAIGIGLSLAIGFATMYFAIVAIPILCLLVIVAVRRYYAAERQSLLWVLAAAAERGIPLDAAARAFGAERNDSVGVRSIKLADYLEAGLPLSLALRRSRHSIDPEIVLAADLGSQTGGLGPALRQVVERSDALETTATPIAFRMLYLGFIALHVIVMQTFLTLSVLPRTSQLFRDFELQVPMAARFVQNSWDVGTIEWWFWLLAMGLGIGLFGAGLLWLLGVPLTRFPVIRRLWWQVHCSWILRWLAAGVRQQRPMVETLRLLSGFFPDAAIRRRLDRVARRVEQGEHWCDGLRASRLIRPRDGHVFRAAERAGNLAWALDEMAESSLRRWSHRLQIVSHVAFPLGIVALGGVVLMISLGTFSTLVALIQSLS